MQNGKGREVVIVEAVRTPIGRGHNEKGYYKDTHPNALLAACLTEVDQARRHPGRGRRGRHLAAVSSSSASRASTSAATPGCRRAFRSTTPATTVDRQCGSAQQAVNFGAALVASGVHDVVIGGGVEHMGHIPMGVTFNFVDQVGSPLPGRADVPLQPRAAGDLRRDDRRQVGDPALRARRARRALAPARPSGDRRGPLRARDRADEGQDERLARRRS